MSKQLQVIHSWINVGIVLTVKTLDKVNSVWRNACKQLLAMTSAGEPWQSKWTNHTKRTLLRMNCFIGWTLVSADIHPFTSFSPCLWNRWHSQMGRDDVYLLCLMNFALGSKLSDTVLPEDHSLHFLYHSGLFSTALSCILQDFPVTWLPRWEPWGVS